VWHGEGKSLGEISKLNIEMKYNGGVPQWAAAISIMWRGMTMAANQKAQKSINISIYMKTMYVRRNESVINRRYGYNI